MHTEHHAVLITAASLSEANIPDAYRQPGVDVSHLVLDVFGIDEARALTTQASQTAVAEAGRTFVIVTKRLTVEAQNALLKLFEEPPRHTRFYLIVPATTAILPTLQSRLQAVDPITTTVADTTYTDWQALSLADRLAMIADKIKTKDTAWQQSIIIGAQQAIKTTEGKQAAALVARFSVRSGASQKMLLEELALTVN